VGLNIHSAKHFEAAHAMEPVSSGEYGSHRERSALDKRSPDTWGDLQTITHDGMARCQANDRFSSILSLSANPASGASAL
jgi:hypothetical protein